MNKRIYSIVFGLLMALSAVASQYGKQSVSHWLGLNLTGVEANVLTGKNSPIWVRPGGGGQLHLSYELQTAGFFVNIGIGADYMVTNSSLPEYADAFNREDLMGEPVIYRYVYSDYKEQHRQVRMVIPVQVGYYFGEWVYAGIGATLRTAPLFNQLATTTNMLAEGEYERFIQPIRNTEQYGYWPQAEYNDKSVVRSATTELAVEAEVGVRVPLPTKRWQMRAGAYLGYDLPMGKYNLRNSTPLIDYSAIDSNPFSQSLANTKENIRLYSLLDTSIAPHEAQRIRVGVRVTILFNVYETQPACMCWP